MTSLKLPSLYPPTYLVKSDPHVMAGLSLEGLHGAIIEWCGERCPDSEPACPVCDAWIAFDRLCETFDIDPAGIKGIGAALEGV